MHLRYRETMDILRSTLMSLLQKVLSLDIRGSALVGSTMVIRSVCIVRLWLRALVGLLVGLLISSLSNRTRLCLIERTSTGKERRECEHWWRPSCSAGYCAYCPEVSLRYRPGPADGTVFSAWVTGPRAVCGIACSFAGEGE